jgi:hypothetical protein
MPHFKVLPPGQPESALELESSDGAAALHTASRMEFREVDVFRDGRYVFSVNKQGRDGAFWGLFHKPGLDPRERVVE